MKVAVKRFFSGFEKQALKHPTALIFIVNNQCNLRCGHCFLANTFGSDGHEELNLSEIERIARSLQFPLHNVLLTGGEPTLRNDLIDICSIFIEYPGVKSFYVPSNGYSFGSTVQFVETFIDRFSTDITIQLSLDGTRRTHNKIRGDEKSFDKVLKTARRLASLTGYKQLEVCFLMVLNSANYQEINAVDEISRDIGLPLSFELMRSSPQFSNSELQQIDAESRTPHIEPLTLEEFKSIYKEIKEVYRRNTKLVTGRNKILQSLGYGFRVAKLNYLIEILANKRAIPCTAGNRTGVIYSSGEVALCELTSVVGSLRKSGYNLSSVWSSSVAQKMRLKVQGCLCTHGCFIYDPLRYRIKTYKDVVFSGIEYLLKCS